ncbi:peptidase S10 family protein [Cavenderia fasciculata]|uniref:Carboxypeptidase n=1 Tax=Cavenderia fasciculata TaxID=261658 RepID=F4PJP3_CACFS|nr:peptidase S10 family protein [Cavenderia fasciculata]EGG23817.1 peptidase S10 family protein [Cavenderia fasciculata]|eukprot:XP_004361668.1 peptidase S10 family protein [Cavenderia fasciculata]
MNDFRTLFTKNNLFYSSTKKKVSVTSMTIKTDTATTTSYSGYFNVNETTNANLFYWFFEAQTNASTAPFVIWLTGGPGCSSEMAIFYENGPFKINEDLSLASNPYSWNLVSNILYVDSPVGTGFSYVEDPSGYSTNEVEVASNLYSLLTQFFEKYPQYAGLPFFVFGESYAGHYVPALSYYIFEQNKVSGVKKINLKGLATGNAMVYPKVQYGSLGLMAYSHGLIDELVLKETDGLYSACVQAIDSGNYNQSSEICNSIIDTISAAAGPFNVYDVTKTCPSDLPLCYNFTLAQVYLDQPSVRQSLGIPSNVQWSMCSGTVYQDIIGDWFDTEVEHIPTLLEAGIDVLVYNGNLGWICNFIGSEQWVRDMKWKGQSQFNKSQRQIFWNGPTIAGWFNTYGGLTFMNIQNAGIDGLNYSTASAPEFIQ